MNPIWLLAQSEPSGLMMTVDRLARTPLSQIVIFAAALTLVRGALFIYIDRTPEHRRTGAFAFARFVNEISDALTYAAIVVFFLVRPFAIQTFWIPSGSMIDTLMEGDMIVANKLIYRFQEPKRGDIVVFEPPREAPNAQDGNVDYIKRLIGLPGDTVEIKDRVLYLNGQKFDEPYVDFTSLASGFRTVLPESEWSSGLYPDFKLVEVGGKIVPLLITTDGYANYGIYESGQGSTQYNGAYPSPNDEESKKWAKLPAAKVPEGMYLFMGDNRNGSADGRFWGLVRRDKIVGKSEFIWMPFSRIFRPTR